MAILEAEAALNKAEGEKTVAERVRLEAEDARVKAEGEKAVAERVNLTPSTVSHVLTDSQVIALVKNGVDDDTIAQTVRNAKAVNFDLSAAGRQRLTAGGVSPAVVRAMKARAAQGGGGQ